ncbi:restriction endonuclease subunit M, partial [Bacteroides sp. OttesenSCG-928-D19]|nr:restriction endonuclease subunit M [Bacteroides sp. OttesenSCG-928-D19]
MYNFSNNYNRENFVDFLENNFLPEDFQAKEENLTLSFNPKFTTSVTRLGSCKSLELEVFEIEHNSTHDARVGISRDAFQVMQKNSYCNKALVAFTPKGSNQYRFSYLQIDAEQKDHSVRVQRNYSNPRRYSYLLGEGVGGYTPNKFLLGKGRVKDDKDLAERFSVEVLTKAFYGEISDWYAWAIKTVQFPGEYEIENDEKRIEHRSKNVIRLLTRLLFVWFLKQKNLIPSELFDINFLSNQLLKDFDPNLKTGLFAEKSHKSKYYKAILQNLFFATLNCPITPQSKEDSRTRGFRKQDWYGQGFGYDHLMRYEELFTNPQLFLDLVNAKVPFLNGGLFDCLDDKQN